MLRRTRSLFLRLAVLLPALGLAATWPLLAQCTPVAPDDVTCDAVDDDCDGLLDEDFPAGAYGVDLAGSYVTFGPAAALGSPTFTLELWFRADGAGTPASSGSGGVSAVPLLTKGRGEGDGSNVDMNYFLGIRATDRVLVADFEDTASGLNHPVAGTTPIVNGVWYHAAATFDGTRWRLYLNGALDADLAVAATPRADSIQHAALGAALNSTGVAEGSFNGAIDEARVWNVARSQAEIAASLTLEIPGAAGLTGRWGLNEGCRASAGDSSGSGLSGSFSGTAWSWTSGSPFEVDLPPAVPVLVAPPDGALGVAPAPALQVDVTDPEGGDLDVTFHGRELGASAAPFTLAVLPDTQYYAQTYPQTLAAQTQWIVDQRTALNIVFASHLGDVTNNGDTYEVQWVNADAGLSILDGEVPWGLLPGNHDLTSAGVAAFFDQYFPVSRFAGAPWYGGNYRENKNSYQLFSAGGLDFIILHLEADAPDPILAWANGVLAAHATRRAIVSTHIYLNADGTRTSGAYFQSGGNGGAQIWDELIRGNCNVFMVLAGHWPGESRMTSTNDCGGTVHQILQDYQSRSNGGDGWLRYFTFHPSDDRIEAYTYSPTLDQYENDSGSRFTLSYTMLGSAFEEIGTDAGVASGGRASVTWPGRVSGRTYEWYARVSDGLNTVSGPAWRFTVQQDCTNPAPDDPTCDGVDDDCDGLFDEDYASVPTACGLGLCAATGATSCLAGSVVDSCAPGAPIANPVLELAGAASYVDFGNAAAIADFGTGSFTVETWFRADAATQYAGIFRHGRQGAFSQVVVQLPGSTPYDRITASVEDTAGHQIDLTPVTLTTGVWHHAALVVDRAANRMTLHLDGVPVSSADTSVWGANPIASADPVVAGAARIADGTLSYFLDGAVDEMRIWREARSAEAIARDFRREVAAGAGLAARWGFNEGSGATAHDSAGGNDGTIAGAAWGPGSPIGVEWSCDGLDGDCDGATDESYTSDATCGVGACRSGNTPSACVAGVETPCAPGAPAADDATCNASDDDCDGTADEDYAGAPTTCGVGACEAGGFASCVAGVVVDTCVPGSPAMNRALHVDGAREYVTFGAAPGLGASVFTIETWFNRHGAGVTTNTGTGGVLAVPLLTKGRGEAEGSNVDMNWFLGIRGTDGVLIADFEDAATGANHPVAGVTAITSHQWHHAAAVYDGTAWRLYLDGNLEAETTVGATPRADSIQHAALGTALTSAGAAQGWFDGVLDEARVWDVALTLTEVRDGMAGAIDAAPGLLARWGLDAGTGSVAGDSTGHGVNGTILGGMFVAGTPFTARAVPLQDRALDFDGVDDHVTFGAAPSLGSAVFTLEAWFNRRGTGTAASSGSGGVSAVPLVTKGRGEGDGSNLDMNWFLGIDPNRNTLAADFEDTAGGANHPVYGATVITSGTWHHAAAVYDGTTWRLYLDGVLDATLAVNRTPRADSIQHAALGTAMTSAGAASGRFDGQIDEARVWTTARTGAEILAGMNGEIPSAAGLAGRWGLEEDSGTVAANTAGPAMGTIAGGAAHVDGRPFDDLPVVADPTCDGVDDDCDGTDDEDVIPVPTSCGLGVCAGNAGERVCLGGALVDTCDPFAGASEEACNGADDDCNGTTDDAAPPQWAAEITIDTDAAGAHLSWDAMPRAQIYDVVRGDLGVLYGSGGDFTSATQTCLAGDVAATTADDPADPPAGAAWFYLVRGVNCGGHGSYDSGAPVQQGLRTAEINASPGDCP